MKYDIMVCDKVPVVAIINILKLIINQEVLFVIKLINTESYKFRIWEYRSYTFFIVYLYIVVNGLGKTFV